MRRRFAAAAREALTRHAGPEALEDARRMRGRMLRDLPPDGPWDVKAIPGGLVEVEFVAQALQCAHLAEHPRISSPTTREALRNLCQAGLLPDAEVATLIRADRLWRSVQSMLRLTVGRWREERLPPTAEAAMLRVCAPLSVPENTAFPVDVAGLRAEMARTASEVRAVFARRLGQPVAEGAGA